MEVSDNRGVCCSHYSYEEVIDPLEPAREPGFNGLFFNGSFRIRLDHCFLQGWILMISASSHINQSTRPPFYSSQLSSVVLNWSLIKSFFSILIDLSSVGILCLLTFVLYGFSLIFSLKK